MAYLITGPGPKYRLDRPLNENMLHVQYKISVSYHSGCFQRVLSKIASIIQRALLIIS